MGQASPARPHVSIFRIPILLLELQSKYKVSTRKFGGAIQMILEGLAGVEVKGLPKKDFVSSLIMQGRTLSQIQVASKLVDSDEKNITLGGDGKTKWGHHYRAFDVHLCSGECLVVGVREGLGRTEDEMLETIKEIIDCV